MPLRLIVDTDPGIDDAFALAVAAAHPLTELIAVTTSYGNAPLEVTTANAHRILSLLGHFGVPVGVGAARPLVHPALETAVGIHGTDGLGGRAADFGDPETPGVDSAHDVTVRALESSPDPVVVVAIGPLTNLALLLASRPDLARRIDRVVVMGGAVSVPGNITPLAEFNIRCDPEAARRVLVEEDVPVTLVPLDVTHRCAVDEAWLDRLSGTRPVAKVLASTRETYLQYYERAIGVRAVPLHDAIAMLAAIAPEQFSLTPLNVDVDTSSGIARGAVVADRRLVQPDYPGRPVQTALDADPEAVRAALFDTLALRT